MSDNVRVRITVNRSVVERAETLASLLGVPNANYILSTALGLGIRLFGLMTGESLSRDAEVDAALGDAFARHLLGGEPVQSE